MRINPVTLKEEIICEPEVSGRLIFKISSDQKYLFYQTKNELYFFDIEQKEILNKLQCEEEQKNDNSFQF